MLRIHSTTLALCVFLLTGCGVISSSDVTCRTDADCPAGSYCGADQFCSASQPSTHADAGPSSDAGAPDASVEEHDAGGADAGSVDAGESDAGMSDAGMSGDAGSSDGGGADGGSVDPCSVNHGGCDANATCAVEWDTVVCSCNEGFYGDGETCTESAVSLTMSGTTSCAIRSSGSLWCWGSNQSGQVGDGTTTSRSAPVQVSPGTTWIDVSTKASTTCGIQSDHSLWCWGRNNDGERGDVAPADQTTPLKIGIVKNWATVSRGRFHTCATRTDGSLWCWGMNSSGQLGIGMGLDHSPPVRVGNGTDWATVHSGMDESCGLETTGVLWCWGANTYGQGGAGSYDVLWTPTRLQDGGGTWKDVSTGLNHGCGVMTDGSLWCWGMSSDGALGTGVYIVETNVPNQAGTDMDWDSVSVGMNHTCARKVSGTLWCWGLYTQGQLGANNIGTVNFPNRLGNNAQWGVVKAGGNQSCAIQVSGELFCWGANQGGSLGIGADMLRKQPLQIGPESDWVSVSAGESHACGVRGNGSLWCWGIGESGAITNLATTRSTPAPRQMNNDTDWRNVVASRHTSCAQKTNGTLWCWGDNAERQVGSGAQTNAVWTPQQVSGSINWGASYSIGGWHACGVTLSSSVYCWGLNNSGQLGFTGTATTPTSVGFSPLRTVSAGSGHTCATTAGNELWCWGANASGQLGYSTSGMSQPSPGRVGTGSDWKSVTADTWNTFAIKMNGTLWAWGNNQYGELGLGHTNAVTTPTSVGTATTWLSVSRAWTTDNSSHRCGVQQDGTLWCWGRNLKGAIGDGTFIDRPTPTKLYGNDWSSVTTGAQFTCAIKYDGTLWCWGDNEYGQLGDGTAWTYLQLPVRWP